MSEAGKLRKAGWTVRPVEISIARRMVIGHHYARGASNTATYLHGLFRGGDIFDEQCCGVAWWIPPTKNAAAYLCRDGWRGVLCLHRLVILPNSPKNSCSFLLAQSRKLIDAKSWPWLLTFADEAQGHTGAIYKADNWNYLGKTKPERNYEIRGRMTARKAGGHTRTHVEMIALGARMTGASSKHRFARRTV